MKKLLFLPLLLLLSLFITGCPSNDYDLDGKLVKDADGRIFRIKHNIGDTYYFQLIKEEDLKAFIDEANEVKDMK